MSEQVIRAAAVVAAAALLAAPYRQSIVVALASAAKATKRHGTVIARFAAASLLVAAAWGKIPMPAIDSAAMPAVAIETPTERMKSAVSAITSAARFSSADRALWAHTWIKAGVVVAGDAVTTAVVAADTRSLREFTALALDIAWRRIGRHAPGSNEPLRQAVEAAYGQVIGTDVVPVTVDIRAKYVELVRAIAWAGTR